MKFAKVWKIKDGYDRNTGEELSESYEIYECPHARWYMFGLRHHEVLRFVNIK